MTLRLHSTPRPRAAGWLLQAERVDIATVVMLIAALWLATRPYQGVVLDARFYMVQALRLLEPARFADDLYFRYGATDQFSVFPRLYAPLIATVGVGAAGIVCTVLGQVLWAGGLICLARSLIADRWIALLSAAAVVALSGEYSHYEYGEAFATPRLFAEALTMAGLGLVVRHRAGWGFTVLLLAGAFHPLMALPGIAAGLTWLAVRQPLWWLVFVAAAAAATGLALAGVRPFANLLLRFDPAWFEIARARDSQWLLGAWPVTDYFLVVGTIAMALLAFVVCGPAERRLVAAVFGVAIVGLVGTLVGADLGRDVLAAQLLPWRALWLLTLIAHLYAVPIVVWLQRQGDLCRLAKIAFLTALACLYLSRSIRPVVLAAAPMMVVAAQVAIWQYRTRRPLPSPAAIACVIAIAASAAVTLLFAYEFVVILLPWPDEFWRRVHSLALATAVLAAILLALAQSGWRQLPFSLWLRWFAVAAIGVALLGWDARTAWTRFVESPRPAPPALAALLPDNATVYWEGGVDLLWLRLRRASYFSCAQGTGAVFFRAAAIEFRRRADLLWPLGTLDFADPECHRPDPRLQPERTRADLQQVCRHEPLLDHLVLTQPVTGADGKIWQAPVPYQSVTVDGGNVAVEQTRRFYVYSCAGMR